MAQDQLREVALFVSPEVEEVLADNGTSIVELLQDEGLELREATVSASHVASSGTKEPVTIILASSAVIAALNPTFTKIIAALSKKQIVVSNRVRVPVETANGEVVHDKDGNPILQWVDSVTITESHAASVESSAVRIETPLGFKYSFEAETHD